YQSDDSTLFIVTFYKRFIMSVISFFVGGLVIDIITGALYPNTIFSVVMAPACAFISLAAMNLKLKSDMDKWHYLAANTDKAASGERYKCEITEWAVKTEEGHINRYFLLCKYTYIRAAHLTDYGAVRESSVEQGIFRVEVPNVRFNPEKEGTVVWICKGNHVKYLSVTGLGRHKSARVMLRTRKNTYEEKSEMEDY
ncbi:MAG: hypothetical protein FWH07_07455, partial [Oscillospiraceae bacterium]|nr:hypothetical protein [Oscillospiraceae bacterium]